MSRCPAPPHAVATDVSRVPAVAKADGFLLLVLRELPLAGGPAGFALIAQDVLRPPQRLSRHGVSFALTFNAAAMADLARHLGRAAVRQADGTAARNPRWPNLSWRHQPHHWADGTQSVEWWARAQFSDRADWALLQADWHERLGLPQRAQLTPPEGLWQY